MRAGYRPSEYWEGRLSGRFSLPGVGHPCFSERYNRWLYRATRRALLRALSAHGVEIAGKSVCDVGCGTGYFIDFYLRRGAREVTGVDITAVSTDALSRRRPACRFVRGDISSPRFDFAPPGGFDIVNAFDVLYHVTDDGAFGTAIGNLSRLCAPGGWIFLTDLLRGDDRDAAPHVRSRGRARYEQALAASGAAVRGIHPLYSLLNRPLLGAALDDALAPLYFAADGLPLSAAGSNLKIAAARKGAP